MGRGDARHGAWVALVWLGQVSCEMSCLTSAPDLTNSPSSLADLESVPAAMCLDTQG